MHVNFIPTIPFLSFLQAKGKEKNGLAIQTNVSKWRLFQCKTALISPNFRHVEMLWACSHYSKERRASPGQFIRAVQEQLALRTWCVPFRMGRRFWTSLSLNKNHLVLGALDAHLEGRFQLSSSGGTAHGCSTRSTKSEQSFSRASLTLC